jgi:hypothetical protein
MMRKMLIGLKERAERTAIPVDGQASHRAIVGSSRELHVARGIR